jgi:hypothetical protein
MSSKLLRTLVQRGRLADKPNAQKPSDKNTLCQQCRHINRTMPTTHHNLYGLRHSATNGCPCCQFIYKVLMNYSSDLFRDNITIWPDDPCNKLIPVLNGTLIYKFPSGSGNLGSRFAFRNHDWLDVGHAVPSFELVVRNGS